MNLTRHSAFLILLFLGSAILLISSSDSLQKGPVGFASLNGSTTGGSGGDTVTVTSRNELLKALNTDVPLIVYIKDTIDLKFGEFIPVERNNISIIGKSRNAMLRHGGLQLIGNNIIVQNLSIGQSYTPGHWDGKGDPRTDAITVYGKNIWIDHCDLFYSHDGLIDFSDRNNECADYVTVSWTRFSNHNKVMLVGSNDQCTMCRGEFHITVHHCWFDGVSEFYDPVDREFHRVQQRMPRVRFGQVHVFNNYYEEVEDYAVAARLESEVVVQNCFFRNLEDALIMKDFGEGIRDPELRAAGNIYENVEHDPVTSGQAFDPSGFYQYIPDKTNQIPEIVMNGAGKFNRLHNEPPEAKNDTVTVSRSAHSVIICPLKNDSDINNDSIRISAITNSPAGKWFVFPTWIEYFPNVSGCNADLIEYQVIDFEGGNSKANIYIRIVD